MDRHRTSIPRLTTTAFLAAVGVALHVLESVVPLPVPFLKIGFANTASLIALMVLGPREMIIVVCTRVIIGSLLIGSLFSPSFVIGLAGGIVASLMMIAARTFLGGVFGVIGISLIGSVAHVVTQLLVVMALFVGREELLYLLPLLLLSALIGGLLVGLISHRLLPVITPLDGSR